jgi:protein-disulfide isomerase
MPFMRTSPRPATNATLAAITVGVLIAVSSCSKPDVGEVKPAATPEVTLKGVDTSPLTPRERREWASQVSELLAPCPEVPVSIAQCVSENRPCKTCLPAAQFLLKQVQAGKAKKEREDAFHSRFDAGKIKTLVTDGSPEMGSPDAVVTIVEWADFECPFCRAFYSVLDEMVRKYPSQVRLVYKFYPLQAHPHGEIAARAAVAALNQGKFWEMHHMLFENQEHLEQSDLEKYAKTIGLDLGKFRSDFGSKELGERIEKDKKQAEELGLDGTPFLFINGRLVNLTLLATQDDVSDWIKLEIELAGQKPNPAPAAGTGSAAAAVAPAPQGTTIPAAASGAPAAPGAPPKKK